MKKWQIGLVIGTAVAAWVMLIGGLASFSTSDSAGDARVSVSTAPSPTIVIPALQPTPLPELALVSASCAQTTETFIECGGFVRNLSTGSLEDILAVAVFTDAAGTPVSSDDALIDYNPLLADQESPWSIVARYNPAFTQWRIEFRTFGGERIAHRDDR